MGVYSLWSAVIVLCHSLHCSGRIFIRRSHSASHRIIPPLYFLTKCFFFFSREPNFYRPGDACLQYVSNTLRLSLPRRRQPGMYALLSFRRGGPVFLQLITAWLKTFINIDVKLKCFSLWLAKAHISCFYLPGDCLASQWRNESACSILNTTRSIQACPRTRRNI